MKSKKVPRQTGTSNAVRDAQHLAKLPGKRVSKNGKVYDERRKNRSDTPAERAWYKSPTRKAGSKINKKVKKN